MPSSRIRLAALANSRLAAFPQAINNTNSTAPSSSHMRGRTGPTALSMKLLTNAPHPLSETSPRYAADQGGP